MRVAVTCFMLVVCGHEAAAAAAADPVKLRDILIPGRVCSMTTDWQIGSGAAGEEAPMIETVRPITRDGRKAWRSIHHSADPLSDAKDESLGFDATDVDAQSLRPIEGRRVQGTMSFHFTYAGAEALKLGSAGAVEDRVALGPDYPLPWYPGSAVLTMAIPWRVGLKASGTMVDNYVGTGNARLRNVLLTVSGHRMLKVEGKLQQVYDAVWTTPNGFEFRETITASLPHRAVESRMFPRPGGRSFDSHVVHSVRGLDCSG